MNFLSDLFSSFGEPDPQQVPQGDSIRGRKIFNDHCADCHFINRYNDSDADAPNLRGIIGRKSASTDFKSSLALKKANIKWDQKHLFKFLRNPQRYIPGIAMTWSGTRSIQQRADLIAYLKRH